MKFYILKEIENCMQSASLLTCIQKMLLYSIQKMLYSLGDYCASLSYKTEAKKLVKIAISKVDYIPSAQT